MDFLYFVRLSFPSRISILQAQSRNRTLLFPNFLIFADLSLLNHPLKSSLKLFQVLLICYYNLIYISTCHSKLIPRPHCNLSNLILIETLPHAPHRPSTKLLFSYINARNLKTSPHTPDIVTVTETRLMAHIKICWVQDKSTPTGYKLLCQERPALRWGREVLRCLFATHLQ